MLRIRLRRTGKKHQPHYRIVVAEHTAPVTGKYVSVVGHYNPRSKELVVNETEVTRWLDQGAQPSNTIAKLLTKQGVSHKQIKIHLRPVRPGKHEEPAAEATPAEQPAATDTAAAPEDTATEPAEDVAETPAEPTDTATATDAPAEDTKE